MDKPYLLHMLTSMPHVSPFDVNMAYDAGYDAVIPYVGVGLDDIAGLTQDTIFSRGPKGAKRTGIFIGGRECGLAADMLEAARTAMVPPFEVSLCADPSGAFTTAAAMVAKVERLLEQGGGGLQDMVVAVFGSGPVGSIAAVLCSLSGAQARLVSHSDMKRARDVADNCNARYGTRIVPVAASTDDEKAAAIADAAVVLACAKAGVQVLNAKQVAGAAQLVAVADVNAVPPEGIAGVGAIDDGKPIGAHGALGIGALAIGNVKYQVQRKLLETMRLAEKPVCLDCRHAFAEARRHVA